jgi:predicted metalloprotease
MRLDDQRRSSNVEDQRGSGGGVGLPVIGGGIGTIVILIIAAIFGINPRSLMQSGAPAQQQQPAQPASTKDPQVDFVAAVLGDTEDVWHAYFKQNLGGDYEEPKLVLFSGAVQSACGFAQAATGPFYCPLDHKVYIDLSFYRELHERFKAPGDFAEAYVIAHEVGHHVQNLLGTSEKVHAAEERASERQANELSVRLELQADCYAGIWAHHAQKMKNILEPGDVEEALNAASAIGDDRLQMQSRGYVAPDSFTHGSSAQRVRWFRRGFDSGAVNQCDTFRAGQL